jgi:CheY-like chemotaxis protein
LTDSACVGRRIAVVDDNVDNAELLGELLASVGFEVEVFCDPVKALARFAKWAPEVAILDIGLPVMDGHALARAIRGLPGGAQCKLIALSGYGQAEDRARSMASGFEAHWVKPADPATVMAQVRKLLALQTDGSPEV